MDYVWLMRCYWLEFGWDVKHDKGSYQVKIDNRYSVTTPTYATRDSRQ